MAISSSEFDSGSGERGFKWLFTLAAQYSGDSDRGAVGECNCDDCEVPDSEGGGSGIPGVPSDYILDFGPLDPLALDPLDLETTNNDLTLARKGLYCVGSHPGQAGAYVDDMQSGVNLTFMNVDPPSPTRSISAILGFRSDTNVEAPNGSFQFPGSGSNEVGLGPSGMILNGSSVTPPTGTIAENDTLTLAVDTATGKFWFGKYENEALEWFTFPTALNPDPLTGTDEHGIVTGTTFKFIMGFPFGNTDCLATATIQTF